MKDNMSYGEFKKMTEPTIKRRINRIKSLISAFLFKCKVAVFELLAKINVINKHYINEVNHQGSNQLPVSRKLKSDRFVFDVSYVIDEVVFIYQYYFYSKKGKRLLVIADDYRKESRIRWRAELKSFLAHFNHRDKHWVHRESSNLKAFNPEEDMTVPFSGKEFVTDFSKCRYAFEFAFDNTDTVPLSDVIEKSYNVLKNGLNSKVVEMNKQLTGVPNDGELVTKEGQPLAENMLCNECGFPVFMSSETKYGFMCIHHKEIKAKDCKRVDPVKYKGVLLYCLSALERFCESR